MVNRSTDTDESLVRRMAGGDAEAVSLLYDRHRGVVFSLALRVLRDRAEAEEVLVDVFHQAWRGAGGYDRLRGSVPAWLVTLSRSRALDRWRARGRREAAVEALARGGDPPAGPATPHAAPGEEAVSVLRRRRIVAALAGLSPAQRAAIELAYYEGLTHSEIAARLREPLGTVKTRIRQGLLALRESLAEQHGDDDAL